MNKQKIKAGPTAPPDPEVRPLAKRRRFTAQYKLKILAEADAATASGAIGALLRREGLYSSMLANWRKERASGMEPRARGPKPRLDPSAKEVHLLRRDNERLTEGLRKAEIIIDVQKKWPRSWAGRWLRRTRRICSDGRGNRLGQAGRSHARLRRSRHSARFVLSPFSPGPRPAPEASKASARPHHWRAGSGPRPSAQRALPGSIAC